MKAKCYFCERGDNESKVYNFKHGPTGKRGTYRRRICEDCIKNADINTEIRGLWNEIQTAKYDRGSEGQESNRV